MSSSVHKYPDLVASGMVWSSQSRKGFNYFVALDKFMGDFKCTLFLTICESYLYSYCEYINNWSLSCGVLIYAQVDSTPIHLRN